jgi:hypothetical protein
MHYRATQEGRIVTSTFLKVDPTVILADGVRISLDVSNKSGVEILPAREALDKIDQEVIYSRTQWKDPAIQARLRIAEKYELLIPTSIAPEFLIGI